MCVELDIINGKCHSPFIHCNYLMTENLELDGQTEEIRAVWKLSFLVPSLHQRAHCTTLYNLDGDRSESQQRHHVKALDLCLSLIFFHQRNEKSEFKSAGAHDMKCAGGGGEGLQAKEGDRGIKPRRN